MNKDRESVHPVAGSEDVQIVYRRSSGEKQTSEPLPFEVSSTNDAMAKVIKWFANDWTELISDDDANPR